MTWPPAVKVCGLMRPEDAAVASAAGAAYLGVILAPGGKRTVTAARANVILGGIPARRVGVFVDAGENELLADAREAGLHVLQLHGDEPPELADRMRAAGYEVWKAVRARGADDFSRAARRYAGAVDALLLDGYSPAAHGGTGTRFPWAEVAERLGELPPGMRLVAAGGLTPRNVAEAAAILRPHAVDVSSGVEASPGVKDPDAVRAFVEQVQSLSFKQVR
ncbi:MAG TPA: phosphoribosylanthranilate isomerase [Longimicrobium sp.]|jgi:phosphoribosylanthranilate isomerase|uniref:phosphoribosylanthranilate isomerase n=1 Tax=Longimicrobium sp. TaxID=2029185 RepID=UPI002EDA0EAD